MTKHVFGFFKVKAQGRPEGISSSLHKHSLGLKENDPNFVVESQKDEVEIAFHPILSVRYVEDSVILHCCLLKGFRSCSQKSIRCW